MRKAWSQNLLQHDKLLPEQPDFRMPLHCGLGDPGLGRIAGLWRSSIGTDQDFHGLPASSNRRPWVVWVVSVLKTAQCPSSAEPILWRTFCFVISYICKRSVTLFAFFHSLVFEHGKNWLLACTCAPVGPEPQANPRCSQKAKARRDGPCPASVRRDCVV